MAEAQDEFRDLMRRVQHGDQAATRELVEVYGPHILRVVRRRLHERLRTQFDSRDFEQDVWASFFAAAPAEADFNGPEDLIKYLVRAARSKVIDAFRRRTRDGATQPGGARSLDGSAACHAHDLEANQPTPSRVAIGRERWQRLMEGQPVHYRRILLLLSQGMTRQQIAEVLGVNERTIRRVIEKLAPEALA